MDDDIATIVLPFATHCAHLQSFAIKHGDTSIMSCHIIRRATGFCEVTRVHVGVEDPDLNTWNPPKDATWSNLEASAQLQEYLRSANSSPL